MALENFHLQSLEIDDMIERISHHKGCTGVMVFSMDGIAIKSTLDDSQTTVWGALIGEVVNKARGVAKAIKDGSHVTLLRIRSTNREYMIAQEKDYIVVAVHQQEN